MLEDKHRLSGGGWIDMLIFAACLSLLHVFNLTMNSFDNLFKLLSLKTSYLVDLSNWANFELNV